MQAKIIGLSSTITEGAPQSPSAVSTPETPETPQSQEMVTNAVPYGQGIVQQGTSTVTSEGIEIVIDGALRSSKEKTDSLSTSEPVEASAGSNRSSTSMESVARDLDDSASSMATATLSDGMTI